MTPLDEGLPESPNRALLSQPLGPRVQPGVEEMDTHQQRDSLLPAAAPRPPSGQDDLLRPRAPATWMRPHRWGHFVARIWCKLQGDDACGKRYPARAGR